LLVLARYIHLPSGLQPLRRSARQIHESNFVWVSTVKREETCEQRLAETLRALAAGRKWIDRKKA